MPDSLLTLPLLDAVRRILDNTSLRYLEELRIQQYIHLSPGVMVPHDIACQISVGAKYIFHQPTNANLITEAWKGFNHDYVGNFIFFLKVEAQKLTIQIMMITLLVRSKRCHYCNTLN